jgi:microfibrillar-associated protein 1
MKAREHAENGAEEELPYEPDDEVENDEENESSSVSDSEEAQDQWNVGVVNRLLPRFVKKEKRQTISEKEQLQKEEERLKEEKEKAVKERKDRTRQLLKEAIEREKTSKIIEEEVVLTDDDENEETQQKEYELWKLRELVRIRRERDDREKWRLERLEVDRRRALTDEELMNEKRKNKEGLKDKKYMKYLQKYYHKGAFFHENIRDLEKTHEWTAATGEDKWIDRTMLPKVMQVKNFGRAGRTKYTHLKNEDTTKTDDPWSSVAFNPQYLMKLGGFGGGFDRPAKKRKIANPVIL